MIAEPVPLQLKIQGIPKAENGLGNTLLFYKKSEESVQVNAVENHQFRGFF